MSPACFLRALVCLGARFLSQTAVSLAVTGSRGVAPGRLFSRLSVPAHFSTASSGISRVPVEPFAGMPCSQIPAEPPRLAIAASWCCPPLPRNRWTSTLRSFRDSIARPSCSLCTLHAAITDDDAKLASGGWPTFPGWDSSVPTEFCREVSASRLPLPLGFAWR